MEKRNGDSEKELALFRIKVREEKVINATEHADIMSSELLTSTYLM